LEYNVEDFHFHYTQASINSGCEVAIMLFSLPTTGEGMYSCPCAYYKDIYGRLEELKGTVILQNIKLFA
jgi:hypothetical protein